MSAGICMDATSSDSGFAWSESSVFKASLQGMWALSKWNVKSNCKAHDHLRRLSSSQQPALFSCHENRCIALPSANEYLLSGCLASLRIVPRDLSTSTDCSTAAGTYAMSNVSPGEEREAGLAYETMSMGTNCYSFIGCIYNGIDRFNDRQDRTIPKLTCQPYQ